MKFARITLLSGPTASGKTAAVLDALRAPRQGRAIVLVPSRVQQQYVRARLVDLPRTRVHQFFSLSQLIVRSAGIACADLSDTARVLLLRTVLRDLAAAGRLPIFGGVAHKPGFVATVGTLLAEAQQAALTPQLLTLAGVTPYDAELGTIYAAYLAAQERLGLADSARRLALASAALAAGDVALRGLALLVVDGFDQFTPLQLQLLAALSHQAGRTLITLTGGAEDRPAYWRFARTLRDVQQHLAIDEHRVLAGQASTALAPALAQIQRFLFDLDPPAPVDAGGALTLIEAADREREVRAALRHVRQLCAAGVDPQQVALLFRDGALYAPLLREIAAEYELPLALYEGLPLELTPLAIALLNLLRLPLEDYPRRALVETWRRMDQWQPSLVADLTVVDAPIPFALYAGLLERAARAAGITLGLERLRSQLQRLSAPAGLPDGATPIPADAPFSALFALAHDDAPDPSDGAVLTPAQATLTLRLLDAFVAWLTPPERAPLAEYLAWLRAKLGDWRGESVAGADDSAAAPDRPWLRLMALLDELDQAATLLNEPPIPYSVFVAELGAALSAARYGRDAPGPGRVTALSVLAARGLCFDHVLVLGLADGEFPLRLPEPPIYSRRERALLAERGVRLPAPDPADERSLFYETVARARCSLVLTRTYLDESGNPLPASPYLAAVRALVQPESIVVRRVQAGSVPTLAEAASPQEQLVALMVMGSPPTPELPAATLRLYAHVQRACEIERQRESNAPYGPYEGVMSDAALLEQLGTLFGPDHHWSVTQFNDYITCPFRFAAAHVLGLRRRDEPEEGLGRNRRGLIYHAILAEAGQRWRELRYPHSADYEEAILAALTSAAAAVFARAATDFGIEPGVFWDWEKADIQQRLVQALRRVLRAGDEWVAFRPVLVEVAFGGSHAPLELPTAAGLIRVQGRVDRVDRREDGALALIDYKSNSTPRPLEEALEGYDLQLAVYLLAVEQRIAPGQRVERAAFLHLGSGRRSAAITTGEREQVLATLRTRVAEVVLGVRAGNFAVRPRDKCPPACTFQHICRLNLRKRDA